MKKPYLILLAFIAIATIAIVSCSNLNTEKKVAIESEDTNEAIATRTAGVTYTVIDTPYSLNLTITFYEDGTNSLTASEKTTIGTYLESRFSSYNFTSVSRTDAAFGYDANEVVKEEVTIYGFGEDSQGGGTPIGFVFNGDGDGSGGTLNFIGGGTTASTALEHSCSGNPCTCCDFLWKHWTGGILNNTEYSKIIGCKCTTTPAACFILDGRCDHTKTSKSRA